jgi:DNA helicase TIP49 (TBP-interacting protein)
LESEIDKIVIFENNRGRCVIRGNEEIIYKNGINMDIMDRILIISKLKY